MTHRYINRIAIILVLAATAAAETQEWVPGVTIDCPVAVSTDSSKRLRTVEFPCNSLSKVKTLAKAEVLEIEKVKNRVSFALKSPDFEATVEVYDDNNRLYLLRVRSPDALEDPDDNLILVKTGDAGGRVKNDMRDADSGVMHLMGQMVKGVRDPDVRHGPVTRVERNQVVPGKVQYEDDDCALIAVHAYSLGKLYGVECVATWHGKDPAVVWNTQQLWFPGILAVHASDQVVMQGKNPDVMIKKGNSIRIFFVGVEE